MLPVLATGIFPPRSLTQQYNWLARITWDIAYTIPRVGEKASQEVWGLLQVLLKNPPQKRAEKLFLPGLFTSKLQQGPFCREKVFCWSCCKLKLHASCVSVKPWRLVVQGISWRLLEASLDGTVCIYAEQFYQTPKLEGLNFWLDEAWNVIHENYECKFASSQLQLIKFGRPCYLPFCCYFSNDFLLLRILLHADIARCRAQEYSHFFHCKAYHANLCMSFGVLSSCEPKNCD